MKDSSQSSVLLAGGAGYIGVHVAVSLLDAGYDVVIADSLANSFPGGVARASEIAGRPIEFIRCDVRDNHELDSIFARYDIAAVVNLAGLKCAPQSVADPIAYNKVNLEVLLALLAAMRRHGCNRIMFSSSAALYGPRDVPVREDMPARPVSPYAWTKFAGERIISDVVAAYPDFRAMSLRYFNPVGAHPSGLIGERGRASATSLFPLLTEAAETGQPLPVYGLDWPTRDRSCIRDFVHVCDIAEGHVAAVDALFGDREPRGHEIINLGSGEGVTVLEAIDAFARVIGRPVNWFPAPKRPGDIGVSVADATRARQRLGWKARRGIDEMCRDALRWRRAMKGSDGMTGMAAEAMEPH